MPEVRLIDEEGRQVGVVRTAEALNMAREREVDLVEVAAQASPPVARLMDFGRFKYEQSKKEREAKKHQQNVQLREVRMKPKIDDHDVDFKTRTAAKLLKQGDKVKVTVMFRGREITHPQIGKALLDRVLRSLEDIAMLEKDAMLEGRHMTIILAPDKKPLLQPPAALPWRKRKKRTRPSSPPRRQLRWWAKKKTMTTSTLMTTTKTTTTNRQETDIAEAEDPQGRSKPLPRNGQRQDHAYAGKP